MHSADATVIEFGLECLKDGEGALERQVPTWPGATFAHPPREPASRFCLMDSLASEPLSQFSPGPVDVEAKHTDTIWNEDVPWPA